MGHRFVLLLLAGVAAWCASVGCGPQTAPTGERPGNTTPGAPAVTQPTTGAAHPPLRTPAPTQPVVQGKKTITREELKAWLAAGPKARTPDEVKAKLGLPDSTREIERIPEGVRIKYLEYTYKRLSVDAKGSRKVDSVTRILFNNELAMPDLVEFVP